jgi:hypothetical protein
VSTARRTPIVIALLGACGAAPRRPDWFDAPAPCPGGRLVRAPLGASGVEIRCEVGGVPQGRLTVMLPDRTRGDGTYARGARDGAWDVRYPDGTLKVHGTYRDGEMVGEWIRYWSTGAPGIRGTYRRGRRTGAWTFWTSRGVFDRLDYYVDGRPCPAGTQPPPVPDADHLACELPDGTAHGPGVEWHPDGRVKVRGQYAHGARDGTWQTWDEHGELVSEITYVDGVATP